MKKLGRFIIVSILYVLTVILFYCFIPLAVWIFGGSFTDVAQSVPYVFAGVLFIPLITGIIFSDCFDSNFYPKD